ncbi:MAG: DUF547 domain-containing protein [Deltaproteobacteria bacterium]|nr:DUF547 domain-containing protein [Deltaproteobacteria bacterium]MBW2343357.1 DUF547 domain-containing protein [Deltaproteobacteria bacterium]
MTTTASAAQGIDHSLYAGLLEKYMKDGVVNYQGFKNESSVLDKYLKVLEEADSKTLSRNEQFAFYINAYNAWTIKLILSGYPGVKSIKDLGGLFRSPWKKKICRIDGKIITLDDIEHNRLRPRFKDPRVHFAVNCASKGCPPLRSEPYRGSTVDQQLDDSVSTAVNNPGRNRLEGETLYVNKVFGWFSEDFENGVVAFFLKYAKGDLKKRLESGKEKIKIKYLDYDWPLNGK